jgi:ankyrin repeat protein
MKKNLFWVLFIFMLSMFENTACAEGAYVGAAGSDFAKLLKSGTPREVEAAIRSGADVNSRYYGTGVTALTVAARDNNDPEVIKLLINAGADIHASDEDGETPLIGAATYNKNPEITAFLIQAGANIHARADFGETVLIHATQDIDPEVLNVLIQAGADVNAKSDNGLTALMQAAHKNDNPEVFKILIKAGADVNANYGATALMLAAIENDAEISNVLIQAGADVNAKNDGGETPLMYAVWNNRDVEVPNLLIQAGADVNAKSNEGRTPLNFAVESYSPELVSLLLKAGATVSESDVELALANEHLKDHAVIEELKKNLKK